MQSLTNLTENLMMYFDGEEEKVEEVDADLPAEEAVEAPSEEAAA